jgi:hypothetical protein
MHEAVSLALAKIHLPRFGFQVRKARYAFQKISMRKREEVDRSSMSVFKDWDVICVYTLEQGIADGVLVKLCDIRWEGVTKPFVATAHIFNAIGLDGAMEIWKEFVEWKTTVCPTLPEEEQLFYAGVGQEKVWIIEDDSAYTLMYPEDY